MAIKTKNETQNSHIKNYFELVDQSKLIKLGQNIKWNGVLPYQLNLDSVTNKFITTLYECIKINKKIK